MTGLSVLFNLKTDEACYVYDHIKTHRQTNEERYSSLLSPNSTGRRSTSYSDYRSSDRPRYTPVYSDLSPRFRHHDSRLSEYTRRSDSYFPYPSVNPTHSADARIMSKYTRPYERSYDFNTTKTYESSHLNERALARPSDHEAPVERPRPSQSGTQPDTGGSRSSHAAQHTGNTEDRALFNALTNRYQESAERSANDPGARTPFSTWRRSGHFEDVTSSRSHDTGRNNVPSTSEKSDSLKRKSHYDDASLVKGQGQGQSDSMSVAPKEQTDQNPDDLIYNFRKALHRHRISENDSNRLSGGAPDSAKLATDEESVNEKLERLKAAKARIEERKRSENVKSASFATEFKVESNRPELEKSDKEKDDHDGAISEQSASSKSTKLSRQKLVSDDLKAKYIESKREDREKTPEQQSTDKPDSLSKKRSNRKSKHKEHMEYWSKEDSETKQKLGKDEVPSAEEMLHGSTAVTEKSSSLTRKQETSESPFQFCTDYTSKPSRDSVKSAISPSLARKQDNVKSSVSPSLARKHDSVKTSVSPSLARKHDKVSKTVSDSSGSDRKHDKVSKTISDSKVEDIYKVQQQSEHNEEGKSNKTRKFKKYAKAKSHELGALSSNKPEPVKPETKDDTAVSPGLDELSRLERIAKYKEERRKQLATISSKFSHESGKELPSLFLAGTSTQDTDQSLARSKSLKVESERKSPSPSGSVSRSKSLKQDRHMVEEDEDDTSPIAGSKISGLKLAEIGSANQPNNSNTSDTQYNTDNIIDKLQALRKLREEHIKKGGMSVEELKTKRSSREEQDLDKSSRGSSVESFGVSRTLLADRVFEGKDKQDRTPSKERVRSTSREKNTEARHSYKARDRDSIPESESDRTTDVSDADSEMHVRVKPGRKIQDRFSTKDSESANNQSLFEFSTVYGSKKDESVKDRKDTSKQIRTIPEISDEKSSDSGRESVDSSGRVRRKLPSIEDVLGAIKPPVMDSRDHSREIMSPDRRSVSDSSDYELTKDNIPQLSAGEIERRKIASNIQKAKSRFKSDDSEFDGSRFDFTSAYPSKSNEAIKVKTSSLDRNAKLHDYVDKEQSIDSVQKVESDKITAKGLDLAKTGETQTDNKKVKERKYGGGGFELGMAFTPKKSEKLDKKEMETVEEITKIGKTQIEKGNERKYGGGGFDLGMAFTPKKPEKLDKEKTETVEEVKIPTPKTTEVKKEIETPKDASSVKHKTEVRKYGGGGFDLGTSFTPKPVEIKPEVTAKSMTADKEMKEKTKDNSETTKPVQNKYGGGGFDLGSSFVPKKEESVSLKRDSISETEAEVIPTPAKTKEPKREIKYGGGGMDLGTSFAAKTPEKSVQVVSKRRSIDEVKPERPPQSDVIDTKIPSKIPTLKSTQAKVPESTEPLQDTKVIQDTKKSTFTMKPSMSDDQPLSPETKDVTSTKPPSSPRGDRRKLAEQRYGKVSSAAQPFEFSTVYVKKDTDSDMRDVNVQQKSETISSAKQELVETEKDIDVVKPSEVKSVHNLDHKQRQSVRPLSFTSVDSHDYTEKRRSSLENRRSVERKLSDASEEANKSKFEKLNLKAQAVSTATGKIVEHPLSPRRQSPVRSEPMELFAAETKHVEPPPIIPTVAPAVETKKTELGMENRRKETAFIQSDSKGVSLQSDKKSKENIATTDTKSVEKQEAVQTSVVKLKEPVVTKLSQESESDKSVPKYVDLSNIELKSPVKTETTEDSKLEPEVPLFLEQSAKVGHEEKAPERGRKSEKTRAGKTKVEKTVIAQVRNETILQDSTLDDILDRNVDYLSDMEPPDFSARGRGSQKKGRPQSIHEPHKTKRAFKKRAAMRRSKSEDRSHHKVVPEETIHTVTDELKRSIEKIKATTDKVAASPRDVQAIVKQQDKQPTKVEESSTKSSAKPQPTSTGKVNKRSAGQPVVHEAVTSSQASTGVTSSSKPVVLKTGSISTKTEIAKPSSAVTKADVTSQIGGVTANTTSVTAKTAAVTARTTEEVKTSVTPKTAVTPQTFITSSSSLKSSSAEVAKDSSSKSAPQQHTVSSVSRSFIKPQTSSSLELEPPFDNAAASKQSPSISSMLYGQTGEISSSHADVTSAEQMSGVMSDASEVSDRLKLTAGDSTRESETSRITTDSDHSVSSALSDGSRRRRKDKSSMRKSKLNEGQDVPAANRKRETEDSHKSSKSAVRRTSSSRLARETKGDKQKQNEEVLDVFKRHDLQVSHSWKGLNQSSNDSDQIHDKLSHDKDLKHLSNIDRASSKSILDNHSVLPSRFALPSKVSAAISKLTEASERSSRESSPTTKKTDLNSPRGIKRGTNFSTLLQKFSGSEASSSEKSDTDTQSPKGRKTLLRRQEATAVSSQSSDDSRRTPERTQSLRLKMSTSTSSEKDSTVQRSASFKSDFMKRQYSPEPDGRRRLPNTPSDEQTDKPSPELAKVLNKRSQIVAKQQEEGEDIERGRIHDGKVEKADRFSSAGNEEVIADSEVLRMLQSRRKETDSSLDNSSVSETDHNVGVNAKPSNSSLIQAGVTRFGNNTEDRTQSQNMPSLSVDLMKPASSSITSVKSMFEEKSSVQSQSHIVAQSAGQSQSTPPVSSESSQPDRPDLQSSQQIRPELQTQSSYESKATLVLSPTSKEKKDPFVAIPPTKTKSETVTTSVPKLDLSSIDTSLNILQTVTDTNSNAHEQLSQAVTKVNVTSPREVVQFIKTVESDTKQSDNKPVSSAKIELKTESAKAVQDKHIGDEKEVELEYKPVQPSFEKEFRQQSAHTSTSGTIDITNKSEIMRKISTREKTPERHAARKTGPMKVISPMPASSPSTGLTRTESVGRTDSERPKGILKRTPSLKHTGVSVDPELAEVLMSRRTKHDETEEDNEQRKLSVEEEIRQARESQGEKHVDGETDRSISVAERIFQMTNKIEEAKSCPITPRARSGFTTPKSVLLGSGTITPKSQFSFDEGTSRLQPLSGSQLIEKLTSLEDQQSQGVSQKRQKFQQRKRNDPRTRTQPVTLQEIQIADSLETVKKFRSDILTKASKDTFEVILKEQQETEKAEFPLHFRKEKRPRGDRHKTLPVTAAELSAIPEGQVSETMNTLKKRFESQGARDSKADSGILSGGSDGEYLDRDNDSWRSLSVEDNITEDDPVKMSVSAKASMFTQIQETQKEKQDKKSASGAKRYIDRKKRERSRTLPITEDEVKLAAEIADEENGKEETSEKDAGVTKEGTESDSPDELSRQSLKDKVKLFTSIEEEKKEAVKKKGVPPPPKRRKGRLASRFATQPVTIEEVETAAKISPLACSLIKPPDPDILSGLSVKAQRELMVQHAQQTLSQPNSRAGSRASSRATSISDLTEDYQTAVNTEVNESRSTVEAEVTVRPSAFKGKTFTASKSFDESHSTHSVEKFTSDLDTQKKSSLKSELEQKLSLQLHHDSKGILKPNANIVPTISDINKVLKKENLTEKSESSSTTTTSSSSSTEVKSILKKEGSFETRKMETEISLLKSDSFKGEVLSSEVREADELEQSDDMLGSSGDNLDSDEGLLDSNVMTEENIDTPVRRREKKARRRFNRDRKNETERYKTQPTEASTPETEASRLKKKYVGRHLTQPVTPDEKKEAEIVTDMPEIQKSGSIQDRLSALKKSGEEEWRKRVSRPLDMDSIDRRSASPEMTPPPVKMRERKQLDTPRPHSIADRLSLLDSAQANWRDRVGETDVKKFTVEHKISSSGQSIGESPLVARLKGKTPRREPSRESESSDTDLASPSTPTKDGNKIPLPREVICTDIPAELLKEDSKSTTSIVKAAEEEKRPASNIEVPTIDAQLDSFFSSKEALPSKTPELDVTVDDFNELFMNANEMLETVQKVKPKRRHAAKSRNPLKTMSASLEVRSEYTEVITGVADRELKRVKTSQISQNSGFAIEALAGLASKENFSKVELRKTESFGASRLEPYLPLMLIHIKGRRKVQCRLVEPKAESLNSGDCYALITADKIIQWHGEFCNVIEKAKAADFCDFVKQKRDLGCKKARDVMIVEEKQRSPGARHFWELLGGQKPYMASGSTEEDELYENHITETNMIYKMEHNKLVAVDECWGGQPKYEMLNPYQVYVFDFGSEVYVWQGKSVTPAQRKISIKLAQQVWDRGYDYTQCDINPVSPLRGEEDGGLASKSEKRPDWALFGKVNQNMETILFREKFSDWPDTSRLIKVKSQEEVTNTKVDLADLKAYDAKLLVPIDTSPVSLVLEGSHVGRGNSWAQDMDGFIQEQVIETLKIRIWHVLEYDHYEIEDHSYGQFHEGDTYVIRWQYMIMNAEYDHYEIEDHSYGQFHEGDTYVIRWQYMIMNAEYDYYEIEDHSYGQFHEGDTYVIRWQYMIMNAGMKNLKGELSRHSTRGRERCAYFFWQGKTSTVNEKGASALMTVELDEERGPQVRVSEGKEMPCFLNLFKGRMIIHIGKREEEETNTEGPWKMYCLRNEYNNEMCLIEVNLEINNLRSVSSCLLLNIETGQILVWHGCKSPEHTQKLAKQAADNLKERCPLEVGLKKGASISVSEVPEGKETTQFWRLMDTTIGDRSEYHSLLNNPKSFNNTIRLFHMTSVSGVFEVTEILNPSRTKDLPTRFPVLQDDLYNLSVQPGLFLVDNGHECFLWQGWWPEGDEEQVNVRTGSAMTRFTVDRRCAMETTIQYCKEISPDNPRQAFMVYAGVEPLSFTNLFPFWTVDESVRDINIRDGRVEGELVPIEDLLKKLTQTRYTFAELTDTTLPEGVDPLKLETYLSDEEFEEVLHMTREAYDSLPNWKKTKCKQEAGLF